MCKNAPCSVEKRNRCHLDPIFYLGIFFAGGLAGAINALAGGGPILTLGMLSLIGIDPRIANLTSTVALCPGQILAAYDAPKTLKQAYISAPSVLLVLALAGGATGALLLQLTDGSSFKALVPWLILIATALYAWSGLHQASPARSLSGSSRSSWSMLFAPLAVYGGYFGGGNSFLLLALLGLSGHAPHESASIKNALVALINLGAAAVLIFSGLVEWPIAFALGAGGIMGSLAGVRMLVRLPIKTVRFLVILFGFGLSAWMFLQK